MENKIELHKLSNVNEDGSVLMSDLFDIAYRQVYSNDSLCEFVSCELSNAECKFQAQDTDGNYYELVMSKDLSVSFWSNGMPLHFNQFPIYKKLIELKLI